MGENTKIEWADHSFNPWTGCAKVSAACTNCYAESWARRTGSPELWRGERRRTSPSNWAKPLRWNRETPGARVFCASLADVFEDRPDLGPWRVDLFEIIAATPALTWLLLTKRPDVAADWFRHVDGETVRMPPNVWVGTTVEDQQRADERIPHLLRIPARVRFLSCEPLLGPVDLSRFAGWGGLPADVMPIEWVIAGGESGPRARPSHPGWFRSLRDQCDAAGVPFLFKQWGEWMPANGGPGGDLDLPKGTSLAGKASGFFDYCDRWNDGDFNPFRQSMVRFGKARAGRLLDGRTWDEVPS